MCFILQLPLVNPQVHTVSYPPGQIHWEKKFGSPVVGIYEWDGDGLLKVPVTHIAKETLTMVTDNRTVTDSTGTKFIDSRELYFE